MKKAEQGNDVSDYQDYNCDHHRILSRITKQGQLNLLKILKFLKKAIWMPLDVGFIINLLREFRDEVRQKPASFSVEPNEWMRYGLSGNRCARARGDLDRPWSDLRLGIRTFFAPGERFPGVRAAFLHSIHVDRARAECILRYCRVETASNSRDQ